MNNIAIITARGGSKRIPRKNIKEFCGKPIITYVIEAALESNIFAEVMVSTDDEEIAELSRSCGAQVPFMRSAKNSNDFIGTADVLIEVVENYKKKGMFFEFICGLYPTAPFITAKKLIDATELLKISKANALIPVVKFSYPPQRCFMLKGDFLHYRWTEYINQRSQDLEPFYHDTGQFYFIRTEVLLKEATLVPSNTVPYFLSEMEVQDIDNSVDWNIAELKYKIMQDQHS